jgi:hypothetical protein
MIETEIIGNTFTYSSYKKPKPGQPFTEEQPLIGSATFKFEKDKFYFEANFEKKDQGNSIKWTGKGFRFFFIQFFA